MTDLSRHPLPIQRGAPRRVAVPRPAVRRQSRVSAPIMTALILVVALAQGLLHLFLLPPWQHYDEPTHFEYAWLIANRGRLPEANERDQTMRREVAASMVAHHFYNGLTPPDLLTDSGEIWIGISELGHPPAYYALVSLPLRLVRHLDVTSQLYVARATSVLLFLLTVLAAVGVAWELTPLAHPLRWLFPLTVVLLPPFASHMTAVNNDVGAACIFSLFLWITVRLVRWGFSWPRVLGLVVTAGLAVLTKNTAGLAVVLLPGLLVMAWWVRRGWRWRWFWAAVGIMGAVAVGALFQGGDARYWYREGWRYQLGSTRVAHPARPGGQVLRVEVNADDPIRRLSNPLLPADVERMHEQTVTVGGWLWADRPTMVRQPGLMLSPQGSTEFIVVSEPISVTTTPTFFTQRVWIPPDIVVAHYAFWTEGASPPAEPFHLYLDDAFLVLGELPPATVEAAQRTATLPPELQAQNLLRNPSAEATWPRLRAWVPRLLERYSRRPPAYVFNALLDVPKHGPFLVGTIAPWLLHDLFSGYAWAHVRITGATWGRLFWLFWGVALLGTLRWAVQDARRAAAWRVAALACLGGVALVVWFNALLWPLPYNWARVQLPSARYAFVAILPTALFLAGGWWALWPRAWRRAGALLWLALLLVLNGAAVVTIARFYADVAAR